MENEPGALSRVVGLFSARGYTSNRSPCPHGRSGASRMKLQTAARTTSRADHQAPEPLIEVVKVVDLTKARTTERELMMVKVRAVGKEREEMKRMATFSRPHHRRDREELHDRTHGDQSKNDAFLEAIDRSAILETVRPAPPAREHPAGRIGQPPRRAERILRSL